MYRPIQWDMFFTGHCALVKEWSEEFHRFSRGLAIWFSGFCVCSSIDLSKSTLRYLPPQPVLASYAQFVAHLRGSQLQPGSKLSFNLGNVDRIFVWVSMSTFPETTVQISLVAALSEKVPTQENHKLDSRWIKTKKWWDARDTRLDQSNKQKYLQHVPQSPQGVQRRHVTSFCHRIDQILIFV